MTKQQADWAEQHDWSRGTIWQSGVEYIAVVFDSELNRQTAFTNYRDLRAWAGY